jgi:hypothetical protein
MEQRLFIRIHSQDDLQCKQNRSKLYELYGGDALSNFMVFLWTKQFSIGPKYIDDVRKTGRHLISVSSFEFKVHSRSCHSHLFDASLRVCISAVTIF